MARESHVRHPPLNRSRVCAIRLPGTVAPWRRMPPGPAFVNASRRPCAAATLQSGYSTILKICQKLVPDTTLGSISLPHLACASILPILA